MLYAYLQGGLAVLAVAVAAWTDYRSGLIHNRLTVPALLGGAAISFIAGGWMGVGLSVAAALVLALVPLFMFRAGAMGGGDVKLFAALGALLGFGPALEIQGLAFGIGAVQGLVMWVRQGELRRGLAATAGLLLPKSLCLFGNRVGRAAMKKTEIRFGPAICIATIVVVAVRLGGTFL